MFSVHLQAISVAILTTLFGATVQASEYHGYVPKGLVEVGEDWSGEDASQILGCKTTTSAKLHATLSKPAAHKWYGLCASANKVHAQLLADHCFQAQSTPPCRLAMTADNVIRHDPEFWPTVNALLLRANDYGLDD